ncbi:MAG TPA: ApaG domain [Gemmatimonadetes bacterium]|nr:ApaG domain [Gemmatimonadota bacterium]
MAVVTRVGALVRGNDFGKLFRHWRIHDSIGDDTEVDGEGIVGMKPVLQPGESHTYQSFCVLRSPVGYMEGYYTFARPDGQLFRVDVPRFELNGPFVLPNRVQAVDPRDDAPVMN